MAALFFRNGPALSDEHPTIEPLTPDAASLLRLPWLSRFNNKVLSVYLRESPGHALWVPRTGEYAVAEPWRHRSDVANVLEVTARKGREALISALLSQLAGQGYRTVLCSDEVWRDGTKHWLGAGFSEIEKIVFFQRELADKLAGEPKTPLPALEYRLLNPVDMPLLLSLDHSAFPWLWWNSEVEFRSYMQLDNVFVYAAFYGDAPIGYASFTHYEGWGHLDRLAVVSAEQGRKYGAAQLVHAMHLMIELGAKAVALSTQQNNTQSHRLYRAFGFKLLPERITFYGKQVHVQE